MARQTFPGDDRHLILTGADGYIGSELVARAFSQGWSVSVLSRRTGTHVQGPGRVLPWSLGAPLPPAALHPTVPVERQALVHLAHDWSDNSPGPAEGTANLAGTSLLLQGCRAAGLGRFVFVSSQSSRVDAANVYGRVKWRIEQLLQGDREVSARVGLVYGGPPRAMFGLLSRLTATLPVLPMIDPWREVQPIHLDEVCEGLLRLAAGTGGGWLGLAGPSGIPFGTFLCSLARELHGRRLRILPIPLRLALLACDILDRMPFGPKPDRERILGLAGTRPMDCTAHLRALNLTVVPLIEGLRREPASRKAMLAEARALLGYVLRARPGHALLVRYVRVVGGADGRLVRAADGRLVGDADVHAVGDADVHAVGGADGRVVGDADVQSVGGADGRIVGGAGPLPLNGLLHRVPRLLCFAEAWAASGLLAQRLALAMALAEASPEGERALAAGSRPARLGLLACGLTMDAVLLPFRMATAKWSGRGH